MYMNMIDHFDAGNIYIDFLEGGKFWNGIHIGYWNFLVRVFKQGYDRKKVGTDIVTIQMFQSNYTCR